MITVTEKALHALNISSTSSLGAVQDVHTLMLDGGKTLMQGRGCGVINALLGMNMQHADLVIGIEDQLVTDYELMVAQGVTEAVVKHIGQPIDEAEVLVRAKARVAKLMSAPQHSWMFAKPEATEKTGEMQAIAVGIELKVAVKSDGSIKKGGRQVLAQAMYQKHVVEATDKPTNKWFKELLVKELGMTTAGASTYAFNVDSKLKLLVKESRGKKAE